MRTRDEERSEALEPDTADLGSFLDEKDQTIVAEDAEDSPRDTPLAATDYGTTGAAERRDEPLTERLRRELPEASAGHRPVDPDRLAARAFAGRLVADDDQAKLAEGNSGGFSAEEAAMHLVPPPRRSRSGRGSTAERLELLETQVDVLLRTVRVLVEALGALAEAEETLPTEEAGEHGARVNRAAHTAHELLLTLREYS